MTVIQKLFGKCEISQVLLKVTRGWEIHPIYPTAFYANCPAGKCKSQIMNFCGTDIYIQFIRFSLHTQFILFSFTSLKGSEV